MHSNSTVFILAGGRSSRMGSDKAFLRLGRVTLLEHAIATVKELCGSVVLVGDKSRLSPYGVVVEDIFPGQGPLAGIHAGLASPLFRDLNLFLAVDTPAIPDEFLDWLLSRARNSGAVVTVPRVSQRLQPLCAVYRREFGRLAEKALQDKKNKIDPLFAENSTQIIEESEITTLGYTSAIFDNVNTPEDWQRMRQSLGADRG